MRLAPYPPRADFNPEPLSLKHGCAKLQSLQAWHPPAHVSIGAERIDIAAPADCPPRSSDEDDSRVDLAAGRPRDERSPSPGHAFTPPLGSPRALTPEQSQQPAVVPLRDLVMRRRDELAATSVPSASARRPRDNMAKSLPARGSCSGQAAKEEKLNIVGALQRLSDVLQRPVPELPPTPGAASTTCAAREPQPAAKPPVAPRPREVPAASEPPANPSTFACGVAPQHAVPSPERLLSMIDLLITSWEQGVRELPGEVVRLLASPGVRPLLPPDFLEASSLEPGACLEAADALMAVYQNVAATAAPPPSGAGGVGGTGPPAETPPRPQKSRRADRRAEVIKRAELLEAQLTATRQLREGLAERFEALLRGRAETHARDIAALEGALEKASRAPRKEGSTGSLTASPSFMTSSTGSDSGNNDVGKGSTSPTNAGASIASAPAQPHRVVYLHDPVAV